MNHDEPLLRTLSPALRGLEKGVRAWLDTRLLFPRSTMTRATLEGLGADLHRQADALELEHPLLVVMLMGGTGVGKSSLLNALAGGAIAQASFARPTTRDPVVYYHESIQPSRLDAALRHCKMAMHDRPNLAQKVLVDTPDIDSNDLANREKLIALLPVADIVLYVGSQEKYHDRLGWDLFLQQRKRRAFAFVLNKWDRCAAGSATGIRPDEDLLKDLTNEGFVNPLLFRTCAQYWIDKAKGDGQSLIEPPEGEQFQELVQWLELGLSRLEIEAIKARGVGQLLQQLQNALQNASPPDLTKPAERTSAIWTEQLREEARGNTEALLNALEPFQREVEHHFAAERQRHFRGIMGGYFTMLNRMKYIGSTLRDRLPLSNALGAGSAQDEPKFDLANFTRNCSKAASERHLDARNRALANRLLAEADAAGFPLTLLTEPTEAAAHLDWRTRYATSLGEVLGRVEQEWSRPTGVKRVSRAVVVRMTDWLPGLAFFAALALVMWRFFDPGELGGHTSLYNLFWPPAILLIVLVFLHLLVALVLPLRWESIRDEFARQLTTRIHADLDTAFLKIPAEVADKLLAERRQVEQLLNETKEVTTWLEQREQAASVAGLYGR